MIKSGKYKDRPALIVESDTLRAVLLPEDGAKLASLVRLCDGKELLAVKPDAYYRRLTYDGSYVDSECSAFDDMFPTIDSYVPEAGPYAGIPYPDHGEVCRRPFEAAVYWDRVVLTVRSQLFPITYQKTVAPASDGGIDISYRIENCADHPFPFVWAGHIMLRGEDGMCLLTPFENGAATEMMFCTDGYEPQTLPRDRLTGFAPDTGAAYKFYYLDKLPAGYFGVRYSDGCHLMFTFDAEKLPYLGVWLNNGAFQGTYTIAPEPCTAPFDAPHKAAGRGYSSVIEPMDVFECSLHIHITD